MQQPKPTHATGSGNGPEAVPGSPGQPQAQLFPPVSRLLHDLNQPLSAITNYAQAGSQLIANGAVDGERLKSLFDKIAQQSARAAALSQDLRKAHDAASAGPSS